MIISNLLYGAGIKYKYEEKPEYEQGKFIHPDFTIYLENGALAKDAQQKIEQLRE